MRTYGRVLDATSQKWQWVKIESDPVNGDDMIWLTTLIQCLKLSLAESPFYAAYGIPAQASVVQQIFPDFYVTLTQQQFAQHFASLQLSKVSSPTPTYNLNVLTNVGTRITSTIPV